MGENINYVIRLLNRRIKSAERNVERSKLIHNLSSGDRTLEHIKSAEDNLKYYTSELERLNTK